MNRKIAFIAHSIASLDVRCRARSAPPAYKQKKSIDECDNSKGDKFEEMKCELIEKSIMLEKALRDTGELRNKIENMRIEWRSQQEHLGKLHQEYVDLQHTLGQHSVYCATLGATMGSILWKVSRLDGTVECMLEGSRMSELITIMDNSLKAFLEVFSSEIPDPCSNEYQFVLSWCGILTNVSACPDGRYFLSTKPEGQSLMHHLVKAIPKFASANGFLLQRTVLMIIYNLIINTNGMELMQRNSKLTSIINQVMIGTTQPEIQDLLLKLIVSLTQTIPSVQYLEHLRDTLPMRLIETMAAGDPDAPNFDTAQKILRNFERNEKVIKSQMYMKGDAGDKSTKPQQQHAKKYHCKRHCKKANCKANQ